jgi:hypothetical protein
MNAQNVMKPFVFPLLVSPVSVILVPLNIKWTEL